MLPWETKKTTQKKKKESVKTVGGITILEERLVASEILISYQTTDLSVFEALLMSDRRNSSIFQMKMGFKDSEVFVDVYEIHCLLGASVTTCKTLLTSSLVDFTENG